MKQDTYLSQSQPAAPPEKRIRILQQRLHLLNNRIHQLRAQLLLLLITRPKNRKSQTINLAKEGIDEEVDPGALEGAAFFGAGFLEVGGVGVGEELRDDGGFGDDGSVVGNGGDEAAGVDLEIFGGAGDGEVDDLFFKGET